MARKGKMTTYKINSNYLNEEMTLAVYEAETFDSLYENQVCIMQDGDDYFQIGRIQRISDNLHDADDLINTTFVGIHYIDRFDRLKKYHPDGEQHEAYKQFLAKEVLPLLQEKLPLNPLGTSFHLLGDSLAGTIALLTALDHPKTFSSVMMQSPLVNETVLTRVKENIDGFQLPVYHSIGLKESKVQTTKDGIVDFLTPNRALKETLSQAGIIYHYQEIEEGNHTWKFWQKELPSLIKQMLT